MDYPLTYFLDDLLGPGEKSSGTNRKYSCPFEGCVGRPSKINGDKKLEVDLATNDKKENPFHCWSCNTRGKSIRTLLGALKAPKHRYDELSSIIKYTIIDSQFANSKQTFDGVLPSEYKFLGNITKSDLNGRHAKVYLKNRGITNKDIFKYSIGYCETGKYQDRIIIPSYDGEGKINYFVARSIDENCPHKWRYLNPQATREIIPFEMYINWDEPIVICEGGFDLLAIKRNVVPLLDKIITESLMKKILGSGMKKIYMAIDREALSLAVRHCETFMNYGKKVYLVDMTDKDPSAMGFEEFTKTIQKAQPLTLSKIMKLKLQLI